MVGSALKAGDNTQIKDGAKSWQSTNNHVNTHEQGSHHNLKVYHQNVRGLKGKQNMLSNFLYFELSHIVCLTEHHLKDQEIKLASIQHYKLSTKFCIQQYRNGGTCIFVHESINYKIIPTDHIYKEKDLELCAIKVNLHKSNIVILVIYRSLSGNYNYLRKLELFLKSLSTIRTEYIICGDINVEYLQNHSRKQQLDMLLATYNLASIVNFPTRIVNGSSTAIDNFFIDLSLKYTIRPLINGISDHDAQLLVLETVTTHPPL
jgi:hypothetical protein